jgi:hypothetical protein
MKPHSIFLGRVISVLLRSAALVIAVIAQSSPVRSEVLDLFCVETKEGNRTGMRLLIDTTRRSVEQSYTDGRSYQHVATISDQFIRFSERGGLGSIETTIDRIAGTAHIKSIGSGAETSFECRRATKKF